MIHLYDNAIVEDLKNSFNTDAQDRPVVAVVPPEQIISIAAQIQEDRLRFPLVAVARPENVTIDNTLTNFTRAHKGVATVFDKEKNELYYETTMPIKLGYNLVCMSTNTADIDEMIKELLFKYTSQYFMSFRVPYESKRLIRFGVRIDPSQEIQWYSTTASYLQEGKLHSAGLQLNVDGAVLLSYRPVKLKRLGYEFTAE